MKSSETAYHARGNPHPAPDQSRLAQITTETLRDMARLRCLAGIPGHKLEMAGVPHLNDLTIELIRRQREAKQPTIPVVARRGREAWLLTFQCPWCPRHRGKPRTHTHGGGPIDDPPDAGHRVSHCQAEGAPGGYTLEIVMIAS